MKRFAIVALAGLSIACGSAPDRRPHIPVVEPFQPHPDATPTPGPTPLPFELTITPQTVLISSSGSATLSVVVSRREGFAAPIEIAAERLPTHLNATELHLEGDESEGSITLTADPGTGPLSGGFELTAKAPAFWRTASVVVRIPLTRPHGIVDEDFGTGGTALFPKGFYDVQEYSDGRLLFTDGYPNGICRVLQNGTLDATFGSGGCAAALAPGVTLEKIRITSRGILAAGFFGGLRPSGGSDVFVERLTLDGAIDHSFGVDGWARFDLTLREWFSDMIELQDGRILISDVGYSETWPNPTESFLLRLNPDASRDTTFGTNGAVTFGGTEARQFSHLLQMSDGRILDGSSGITVYTSTGEIDPTFTRSPWRFINANAGDDVFLTRAAMSVGAISSSGLYTELLPAMPNGFPVETDSFIRDADNGFVFAGDDVQSYDDYSYALARRLPDGTLDPEFGTNGVLRYYRYGFKIKALADGQLLLFGWEGGSLEDETPIRPWHGFLMRLN